MATAAPQLNTLIEMFDCPVCIENYKDPYILKCGHLFCRICLEGIANEHPQGSVRCPTCREVTEFTLGSRVTDLPRPVLINELQEKISSFLGKAKRQEVIRHCDLCGDKKEPAASHCYQCTLNLCLQCRTKHAPMEMEASHRVVPIADSMFCKPHPKQIVGMFCKDCKLSICSFCVFDEHNTHKVSTNTSIAEKSRHNLQEFIDSSATWEKEAKTLGEFKDKLREAKKIESDFSDSVSRMRGLLKELETKLDQVECDTKTKLTAEIKTLAMYESDATDLMVSRQSLIDHAVYLTKIASDQELIEQEKKFPISRLSVSPEIQKRPLELPLFESLQTICTNLQQMITDFKVDFRREKSKSIKDIKKQHTIKVGCEMSGITMDVQRQRLVARTEGPLKVYDYQGQLQESLGAGVTGLADDGNSRGICIDTKRDCYMAPHSNSLLLVDRAGHLIKSVKVGGQYNKGVAYGEHSDMYVVSDAANHIVFLIDPNTSQVKRQFGSKGSGPKQFYNPSNVHVGKVVGISKTVIIVSDRNNHCLKLFDISGQYIKTYGSPGSGDRQLSYPRSVGTDPNGHVIVTDYNNDRVVRFWTDPSGQDHWERLLYNDWDGSKPFHLSLNTSDMVMAVVNVKEDTLYIYS